MRSGDHVYKGYLLRWVRAMGLRGIKIEFVGIVISGETLAVRFRRKR